MNFESIINNLSQTSAEERATRRDSLAKGLSTARAIAAALVPFGLAGIAFPARAASSVDALNLMLELKLMQLELYTLGTTAATAPATFTNSETPAISIDNANMLRALNEIRPVEEKHVNLLRDLITGMGGTPVTRQFVFSGTGPDELTTTFTRRSTFMAVAQVIEDISARAMRGLLPLLESNPNHFSVALQMQAMDSRHSTVWRLGRSNTSSGSNAVSILPYPDVTADSALLPAELVNFGNANGVDILSVVYQGEDNTVQAGVDLTGISAVPAEEIRLAFDEPTDELSARAILNLFGQ